MDKSFLVSERKEEDVKEKGRNFRELGGKSLQEEQKGKYQREWKRSKGVDWKEMRMEERI